MNVRSATAHDAARIVALHRDANPYGDWYRNPLDRLERARYEDLTPLERYLHGGFWMDLSLFRRHFHELQRRGFPMLVAEERGRIVGECEVWLDEEPEPFGRYAEVEAVASHPEPSPEVERALLRRAAERVRTLGYGALDLSPEHSGGGDVAREIGFKPLWDTRTFAADLKAIPAPEGEFVARDFGGKYESLQGLLALNHREPARWRFENLTARWPAAQIAGLSRRTASVERIVEAPGLGPLAVVAARRDWLSPAVTEVDVYADPSNLKAARRTRGAFTIAVEVARRLGPGRVETFAPPRAARTLRALGFSGGETPDPWLRWTF